MYAGKKVLVPCKKQDLRRCWRVEYIVNNIVGVLVGRELQLVCVERFVKEWPGDVGFVDDFVHFVRCQLQ